jgi:hypothetical protein
MSAPNEDKLDGPSQPKPITQMSQLSDEEVDEEDDGNDNPQLHHLNIDNECFTYTLRHHPEFGPLKHLTLFHFLMHCITSGSQCSEDTPHFNECCSALRITPKALKEAIDHGFHDIHPKVV